MRSLAESARALALLVPLLSAVGLTEQASTAEPDESGAAEGSQTPSQPISTDTLCSALAAAAAQNDLPTDFFARLIWQESRFDPAAVSRPGAQGVAQFMPATATWAVFPIPLTRSKPLPNPQSSCAICVENSEISGLQRPPTMPAPGGCATGSPAGEPSRGRQAPMCAS